MRIDGQAIKKAREKKELSREKLARLADTSTSTIVRVERDPESDVGASVIARISVALGVPLEDLFTEEEAVA